VAEAVPSDLTRVPLGDARVPTGAPTVGELPFTGLGLLLIAVLGLALLGTGLGLRARTFA
jgi:hypothetical protein